MLCKLTAGCCNYWGRMALTLSGNSHSFTLYRHSRAGRNPENGEIRPIHQGTLWGMLEDKEVLTKKPLTFE